MPKRKHKELEEESETSLADNQGDDNDSNQDSNGSTNCGDEPACKKAKKSVNFENVDVYYFPRTQGFACVPSQGGTTLGMTEKHMHQEQYTLKHYRKMRKIVRRKKADEEESAENSFNLDSILEISRDEIAGTDSEEDDTEMDGFYLQPVPIRRRRSLLKLAGVKKLDNAEKDECKELRGSREQCGCDCQGVCNPETCLCSINGIQCQVDRYSFPCGCTAQGCGNPAGRIEFNQEKVRKHYVHTLGRVQEEMQGGGKEADVNPIQSKHPRHVRFDDDGDWVPGESCVFNSTDKGTCLDCYTTSNTKQIHVRHSVNNSVFFASTQEHTASHSAISAFHVASSHSHSGNGDSSFVELHSAPLSLDNGYGDDDNSAESSVYQPISDLLNPILNVRSANDAFSEVSWQLSADEDTVSDWQTLSHESMLTTSTLLPVESSVQNSSHQPAGFDSILSSFQSDPSEICKSNVSPCLSISSTCHDEAAGVFPQTSSDNTTTTGVIDCAKTFSESSHETSVSA